MSRLTEQQIERYSRHILLREVGGTGQTKLLESRVLIIGCGGLGSPAAMYLAAAGIGTLGLVDFDTVDLTNLQRQIIHGTPDLGRPKTNSAEERLHDLNPEVNIICHPLRLNRDNITQILQGYDVVVDGTDNFPSRYLINDACHGLGLPLSHAGILRFDGQVTFIHPRQGPCYRCLYPEPPAPEDAPTCSQAGVLGSVAGVIGALQATEVLKFLLGIGDLLIGKLLIYDALSSDFRIVRYHRDPNCACCGEQPVINEYPDQ